MTVLVARCLQEADRREVVGRQRARVDGGDQGVEVAHVVLVVGRVELAGRRRVGPDGGQGGRGQVVGVGRRGVVLERLVVGDVVGLGAPLAGPPERRPDRVGGAADRLRDAGWLRVVREGRVGRSRCTPWSGLKPPWNQPQLRPAVLSWSPMFCPDITVASRVEQSSKYGWASLISE